MKKNIHQLVEETLSSVDNIQTAEVPNFFITRFNAKLDKRLENGKSIIIYRKPVLLVALLVICITMNVVLLQSSFSAKNNVSTSQSGIESFSEEYNLSTQSPY
jgi:hypothetical protein